MYFWFDILKAKQKEYIGYSNLFLYLGPPGLASQIWNSYHLLFTSSGGILPHITTHKKANRCVNRAAAVTRSLFLLVSTGNDEHNGTTHRC